MKELEVTVSKWRNGQGWEYKNSIIDRREIDYEITAEVALYNVEVNVEPNLTADEAEEGIDYEWTVNIIVDGQNKDSASAWESDFVTL